MSIPNRDIYETGYSPALLERSVPTPYDRRMAAIRDRYLEAPAGARILDLCCGTGAYLEPALPRVGHAVGLDLSATMLNELQGRVSGRPDTPSLVQGDARHLPFEDDSFDLVVSYSSLYHVPDLNLVIQEVARVLNSGGSAALELGNLDSLNTAVSNVQARKEEWAQPFHVPVAEMGRIIEAAGLRVREWRCFQLLPMYGAPRSRRWWAPLVSHRWKKVLGLEVRGKMLDEWVSSARPFRRWAFRHLVVLEKP